jgi:hypothetical protein
MKRLLPGTVLGGLVLFAWGFVSWELLPWHTAGFDYRPIGQAMLLGFAGNLLAAFLATLFLLQLGPRSLVEKVLFLLTAAGLAWAGRALGDVAYRGLPWRHAFVDLADLLVAWLLAGSALAWLTHPRTE